MKDPFFQNESLSSSIQTLNALVKQQRPMLCSSAVTTCDSVRSPFRSHGVWVVEKGHAQTGYRSSVRTGWVLTHFVQGRKNINQPKRNANACPQSCSSEEFLTVQRKRNSDSCSPRPVRSSPCSSPWTVKCTG